MRTITLELLRHGPPHNQLLSPLTPYLALCENHAAVTVQLTFEHNQFLHRLRALGYRLGEEARSFQLKDTAATLGALLAEIPGLTAELSRQGEGRSEGDEKHAHLRLIVSASELALLPFELALAPNGFPGAGQQLLLQNALPLCLTREVRRVQEESLHWPPKPRILLVAASPPGVGPIPLESHLLALRRAIDPWVKYYDEGNDDSRRLQVSQHLVVLPKASISDIEAACATGEYTHIHLLAHGVEWRDDYDLRYAIALHDPIDPDGPMDRVSGARLAGAIRPIRQRSPRSLTCPAVVTLASCNSGNIGSVAGAGASIAHALHEAGIPLVIGSQFPLSFPGSVLMVESLYSGLLWGEDPRVLVSNLRRQLHARSIKPQEQLQGEPREPHDWASIVAYASLPTEFETDLESFQVKRVMAHINTAMNHADAAIRRVVRSRRTQSTPVGPQQQKLTPEGVELLLNSARDRMERARARLEEFLKRAPSSRAEVLGLLASTEKRQAGLLYEMAISQSTRSISSAKYADRLQSRALLRRARDHYWQTFLLDRSRGWGVVQYLSLELVIRHLIPLTDPNSGTTGAEPESVSSAAGELPERDPAALWGLAYTLSTQDLKTTNQIQLEWALGNLIELYLLALFPELQTAQVVTAEQAKEQAQVFARELVEKAGPESFEVYSTRRQMLRYVEWYAEDAYLGEVATLAQTVAAELPESMNEDWK